MGDFKQIQRDYDLFMEHTDTQLPIEVVEYIEALELQIAMYEQYEDSGYVQGR